MRFSHMCIAISMALALVMSGCTALTQGGVAVPPKPTLENATTYIIAANRAFDQCLIEYQKAIDTVNGTALSPELPVPTSPAVVDSPASGAAVN